MMELKKTIKLYYDNSIFASQKIGGISIVFGEIIKRIKSYSDLFSISFLINGNSEDNLIFKNFNDEFRLEQEFIKMPKALIPFIPILKKIPSGAIFHSTYTRYSIQKDIIKIITIHDLGYEHKIMRTGIRRFIHLFFKRIAIRNANGIICVSENTKKDLEFFYKDILQKTTIEVIYNGISGDYFQYDQTLLNNSPKKYILFVGTRFTYKNFKFVVEIMQHLNSYTLVIAGGNKVNSKELEYLNKKIKGKFILSQNLNNQELNELYNNAFCLIYPSSYEGFGIPILEAMSAGCPTIALNASSIPEVSGQASILLDKLSIEAFLTEIRKLENREYRDKIIELGITQAKKFSWDICAEQTMNFYKKMINLYQKNS